MKDYTKLRKLDEDELDKVSGGVNTEEDYCKCGNPDFGPDGALVFCKNCGGQNPNVTITPPQNIIQLFNP